MSFLIEQCSESSIYYTQESKKLEFTMTIFDKAKTVLVFQSKYFSNQYSHEIRANIIQMNHIKHGFPIWALGKNESRFKSPIVLVIYILNDKMVFNWSLPYKSHSEKIYSNLLLSIYVQT